MCALHFVLKEQKKFKNVHLNSFNTLIYNLNLIAPQKNLKRKMCLYKLYGSWQQILVGLGM